MRKWWTVFQNKSNVLQEYTFVPFDQNQILSVSINSISDPAFKRRSENIENTENFSNSFILFNNL